MWVHGEAHAGACGCTEKHTQVHVSARRSTRRCMWVHGEAHAGAFGCMEIGEAHAGAYMRGFTRATG